MPIAGLSDVQPFASTPTLSDLVAEVESELYSFFAVRERQTTLVAPVTDMDTAFAVADAKEMGRGVIEVQSTGGIESVYINTGDKESNVLTAYPWGRGFQGSLALSHEAGSRLIMDPQWPRLRIVQAINEVIVSLYPEMFGVASDKSQVVTAGQQVYSLPTAADAMLAVSWQAPSPQDNDWYRSARWVYLADQQVVELLNANYTIPTGSALSFTYKTVLAPLLTLTDTIDLSGLDATCRDLIVIGAAHRMLLSRIARNVSPDIAQNAIAQQGIRPDVAANAADKMLQRFELRKQQQIDRQRRRWPATMHFTS